MNNTVIIFCAEWCGVCREFKTQFESASRRVQHARFVWVELEEHPELDEALDIETFPTLMVLNEQQQAMFLGPLKPTAGQLERLLAGLSSGENTLETEQVTQVIRLLSNPQNPLI